MISGKPSLLDGLHFYLALAEREFFSDMHSYLETLPSKRSKISSSLVTRNLCQSSFLAPFLLFTSRSTNNSWMKHPFSSLQLCAVQQKGNVLCLSLVVGDKILKWALSIDHYVSKWRLESALLICYACKYLIRMFVRRTWPRLASVQVTSWTNLLQ